MPVDRYVAVFWGVGRRWKEGASHLGEGVQRFEGGAAYRAGELLEPVLPWDLWRHIHTVL